MKKSVFGMMVVAGLAASAMGQNIGATLTDGTHTFVYGTNGAATTLPTSSIGSNVTTNTQVGATPALNQSFGGNWFYRLAGDTREREMFSATSRTLTGTNRVDYTYGAMFSGATAVTGLTAAQSYSLFSTGPDSLCLVSTQTVYNASAVDVVVDMFFAMDMDVGGNNVNSFGGDVISPLDLSGGNRTWIVNDAAATTGPGPWRMYFQGVGANGAGCGGFSAINSQMSDSGVDNFIPDLNAGGLAAADQAEAMQWRVTIPAGGSYTATNNIAIGRNGVDPSIVPAPGALALLGLGGLVAGRRRR